jgi:hypothetical protein
MADITIYQAENGLVEVRLEQDTVWLRQEQMGQLFGRERSVITKHLRNVFAEGELAEKSNVQNLHIAGSDKPACCVYTDRIMLFKRKPKTVASTQFSEFIRNASSAEKKRVCKRVLEKASESQNRVLALATPVK